MSSAVRIQASSLEEDDAREAAQREALKVIYPFGDAAPQLGVNDFVNSPMTFAGIFTPEECAQIVALGNRLELEDGGIVSPRQDYRRAQIGWLKPGVDTDWIFRKLHQTALQINRWYRFEVVGFRDGLQFTQYGVGDGFGWHVDCGEGISSTRKISLSVQLSDPADYDGGGLEFRTRGELPMSRLQGSIVAFPSFVSHCVSNVTRGTRRSLVTWVAGQPFR
jgi:PKHD-type hydroxylase